MKLILLSADDIRRALPMREAIAAMRGAFAALSDGAAQMPQRLAVEVPETAGTMLVKPAYLRPGGGHRGGLGAKLVSVFPHNREHRKPVTSGIVVLLDPQTGTPAALCDGTFLTAWRTGAATGAATDLLAPHDVQIGALFGCGAQARTQALAIDTVRELDELRVYARNRHEIERFRAEMQPVLRARVTIAASSDHAIDGAHLITTATTSATPVFDGDLLRAGTHVNGIGSFTAEMQEIDTRAVGRSRVFVDCRTAAQSEAGDLIQALSAGRTAISEWTEIGEVSLGRSQGRRDDTEITLFKSVGVAVQDIHAGALAFEQAKRMGLGSEVEL